MESLCFVRISCQAAIVCSALLVVPHATLGASPQCGDPKSQAGYFLSVFRDIALNGDLGDRKSIETILETKFDAPREIAGGQAAPHSIYASTTMFGRPAGVVYDQGRAISLTVTMPPSWPALPPAVIERCFADVGGVAQRRQADGAPGQSLAKFIPRVLEGGGKLRIVWSDPANTGRVGSVAIFLDR